MNARTIATVFFVAALAFAAGMCARGGPSEDRIEAGDEVWTCAMHPQVRRDGPGSCPFCGMDLVQASSVETDQVVLSERAKILARIQTVEVASTALSGEARSFAGRVEVDETRMRTVTSWIGGRIDRLHVRETGAAVRRGQAIATLYSPEIYAAHQDLLVAKRQLQRLGSASEIARRGAEAALEAARDRLRLLGYEGARLEALERAERPSRSITIRADASGTVLERVATQGAYVQPGAPLYRVADLSTVWVELEASERDLPILAVGRQVSLSFAALPGRVIEGEVAFIDPVLDARRRVVDVRVRADNEDGALRPGMVADATLAPGEGVGALSIPASAPLFTGRRSIVYVEVPDADAPTYVPRTVQLGPRSGDAYPVLGGLREGERVVTHGAFAIDAELQLRGGPAMMTRADDRSRLEPSDAFMEAIAPVVEAYLDVSDRLAADSAAEARAAADVLVAALEAVELAPTESPAVRDAWSPLQASLESHAHHVMHAPAIAGMRVGFEHLSDLMRTLVRRFGNPTSATIHEAFCPMAFDNRGAHWVQRDETIANAYFGADMLTCGSIEASAEPGEVLE